MEHPREFCNGGSGSPIVKSFSTVAAYSEFPLNAFGPGTRSAFFLVDSFKSRYLPATCWGHAKAGGSMLNSRHIAALAVIVFVVVALLASRGGIPLTP